MKKVFGLLLVFVLAFVLASCKNDDEKEIVVTFAVQSDSTDALDTIVEEFNKKYKSEGIQVKVVKMTNDSGQMKDQLVQSLNSGSSEYDVISMDVVWAAEFASAGFLETR